MPVLPEMPPVQTPATQSAEEVQELIRQFMDQSNQAKTQMFQSGMETQSVQAETMKQALELLQTAGVNPADPASLQSFIQQLEETEPDAAALLQSALQQIFSESVPGEGQGEIPQQEAI